MTSFAQRERGALVETMAGVGPDAPTLCSGWTTRDLAAHLVVRERRPDSAAGILIPAAADHGERVRRAQAEADWMELLDLVRSGPPWWSPLRPLDSLVNAGEMFVHHEDVRRARDGWTRRPASSDPALWRAARMIGRSSYGGTDVSVVFETPDGRRQVVRDRGPRTVTVVGEPGELLLHAFGRDETDLVVRGDPADVAAVAESKRGI